MPCEHIVYHFQKALLFWLSAVENIELPSEGPLSIGQLSGTIGYREGEREREREADHKAPKLTAYCLKRLYQSSLSHRFLWLD